MGMYVGMYVDLVRVVPSKLFEGGPDAVRKGAPGLWNAFKFHPRVRELVRDGMGTESAVEKVVFETWEENLIDFV